MQTRIGSHHGDETLERYALGDLPGRLVPEFEEHLLVCESCQVRLEQAEEFLSAARMASGQLRKEAASPVRKGMGLSWVLRMPKMMWAGGVALLALAMAVPGLRQEPRAAGAGETVELRASRGIGEEMSARASSGQIVLSADLSELRPLPHYWLKVVDRKGWEVWSALVSPERQRISAKAPKVMKAGKYWVRLASPEGELLREYGLEVK